MQQITIKVKNKQKAQALIDFLKAMDLIEDTANLPIHAPAQKSSEKDFFALAGLWAGRDVTLDSIRQKAWPVRS